MQGGGGSKRSPWRRRMLLPLTLNRNKQGFLKRLRLALSSYLNTTINPFLHRTF
jgi:hypothetical protein